MDSTVETILPREVVLGISTAVIGLDNVNRNADDTRDEFGDFERETLLNFAMKAGGSGGIVESIFRWVSGYFVKSILVQNSLPGDVVNHSTLERFRNDS